MDSMMAYRAAVGVQFAAHISSDHSVFLQSVAGLARLPLTPTDIELLKEYQSKFDKLEHEATMIVDQLHLPDAITPQHMDLVMDLANRFLVLNEQWISFIETLRRYAPNNFVWQELISHMQREGRHMGENIRHHMR